MAAEHIRPSIAIPADRPLVGVFVDDDTDLVQYLPEDRDTGAEPSPSAREALSVIGAWSDMDWDDLAESLDRIRHESMPTPPIEL